jgi:hypothetical protein
MESWRNEMREGRINRVLPTTAHSQTQKKGTIRQWQWIRSVLQRIEHYKTEHYILLQEAMTPLELALWNWKANLIAGNEEDEHNETVRYCGCSMSMSMWLWCG